MKKIIHANNIDYLRKLKDNSVDSVVTDPPYGISFMGKKWDYDVPSVELWQEVFRVLKPGGHMLVACGTRTQHRMAVNIEDAGFEIRDIVAWVYGSGFPKSMDVSKALDKHLGAEREVVGKGKSGKTSHAFQSEETTTAGEYDLTKPSTDQAKQWQGWGTALKPAMELWTLARKPLKGTVAQNILEYGVGGINIDGCRVETLEGELTPRNNKVGQNGVFNASGGYVEPNEKGRFPANFIHDGSEEVEKLFPDSNGGTGETKVYESYENDIHFNASKNVIRNSYADSGSASRFFYVAKASKEERNFGLYDFEEVELRGGGGRVKQGYDENNEEDMRLKKSAQAFGAVKAKKKNIHPTVKPIDLMRYLVRMITPPNGICLDPYLGSGTTAIACEMEKFDYIGIELDEQYVEIAKARVGAVKDYETSLDTKTIIKESIKEDKEKELGIQNIFDFMEVEE